MKLLLATTNRGKIGELKGILGEEQIELVGLDPADSTEEIETGATFVENALLKARHYHGLTGLPTIRGSKSRRSADGRALPRRVTLGLERRTPNASKNCSAN